MKVGWGQTSGSDILGLEMKKLKRKGGGIEMGDGKW